MASTAPLRNRACGLLTAALIATLGVALAPSTQHANAYGSQTHPFKLENRTMVPLQLQQALTGGEKPRPVPAPAAVGQLQSVSLDVAARKVSNSPQVFWNEFWYTFKDEDGATRTLYLVSSEDASYCQTDSKIFRCTTALAGSSWDEYRATFAFERKDFTVIQVLDTAQPALWRQLVDLCFVPRTATTLGRCEPSSNGRYRAVMSNTYYDIGLMSWLGLPHATYGLPYSAPVLADPTIVAPYPISVIGLPSGLRFDPTEQRIVGTPTGTAGPTRVRFGVTLPDGTTLIPSSQYGALVVDAGAVRVLTESFAGATVGTPYEQAISVDQYDSDPMTVNVTGLPGGLTFNHYPATIVGTPTVGGVFPLTVKVTTKGGIVSKTIPLSVSWPAPKIKTTTLREGTVGASGSWPISVDLSGAPYSSSTMTATGLPPGTRFSEKPWAITGTPTAAGSYPVTLTLTTGNSRIVTATLALVVKWRSPEIKTTTLTGGHVGSWYTSGITVVGYGPTDPTVKVYGLPPGLVYIPSGAIIGHPTEAGTYQVRVTATTDGRTSSRTLSLVVAP